MVRISKVLGVLQSDGGMQTVPRKMQVALLAQAAFVLISAATLAHTSPTTGSAAAALAPSVVKLVAYAVSALTWRRSTDLYLRLMFIWTAMMALGVARPLRALDWRGGSGSGGGAAAAAAAVGAAAVGIAGNVLGAAAVFGAGSARRRAGKPRGRRKEA